MNGKPSDRRSPQPASPPIFLARLPDLLCYFRLVGSLGLVALAALGYPAAMFGLLLILLMTDWIDGRLARRYKTEHRLGAILDTVSDVMMYGCVLIAAFWFAPEVVRKYASSLVAVVVSYLALVGACWLRFRKFPSFHTRLAKKSWLVVGIAIVSVLWGFADWPVLLMAVYVTVTNLEALLITLVLREFRVDVPSIFSIWSESRDSTESSSERENATGSTVQAFERDL